MFLYHFLKFELFFTASYIFSQRSLSEEFGGFLDRNITVFHISAAFHLKLPMDFPKN